MTPRYLLIVLAESSSPFEAQLAAQLDESAGGVDLLGTGRTEHRVEEVRIEVDRVPLRPVFDQLLSGGVNRQHRHVEARIEKVGQKLPLGRGGMADEERQSLRSRTAARAPSL